VGAGGIEQVLKVAQLGGERLEAGPPLVLAQAAVGPRVDRPQVDRPPSAIRTA
jgi:hypothetical protein